MAIVQGIVPTITLRGIKMDEVYRRYMDGEFNDMSFELSETIPYNDNPKTFCAEFPFDDKEATTFSIRSKDNAVERIATTDCADPGKVKLCQYCMLHFEHEKVGIPVKVLKNISDGSTTYYWKGIFCGTSCADAKLRTFESASLLTRQSIYMNSRGYLIQMHDRMHPGVELTRSPEYDLLEEHGGSMSREKYFSKRTTFRPVPNVYYSQARTCFSVVTE